MDFERIIIACMAAVYAGNLEASGEAFPPPDFGADSIEHLYEYVDIAKEIEIPYDDETVLPFDNGDRKIDTETLREMVYQKVKEKYVPQKPVLPPEVEAVNQKLRDEFGDKITVQIEPYEEDNGSTWYRYWYRDGFEEDWEGFELLEDAYEDAREYLKCF